MSCLSRWEQADFGESEELVVVMKKGVVAGALPLAGDMSWAEIGSHWTGIHRFAFSAVTPLLLDA